MDDQTHNQAPETGDEPGEVAPRDPDPMGQLVAGIAEDAETARAFAGINERPALASVRHLTAQSKMLRSHHANLRDRKQVVRGHIETLLAIEADLETEAAETNAMIGIYSDAIKAAEQTARGPVIEAKPAAPKAKRKAA